MLLQITLALTSASLGEDLTLNVFEIVLIGFSFVFCVLLLFSFTTSILGKFFARLPVEESSAPANAEQKPSPPQQSNPPSTKTGERIDGKKDDPQYIAVIAAAVHCAMAGQKHQIVSIRSSNSSWAAEGRREIFSSHNLR